MAGDSCKVRTVTVFCGASIGVDDIFAQSAAYLGSALVARGKRLVYGGARAGLMGVLADTVLQRGGMVTGFIPRQLVDYEAAHQGLDDLRIVPDMHTRKLGMFEAGDAFIAMPGGLGTLEELFEVYTWVQLGIHRKPISILNVDGYYDDLLAWLNRSSERGFIREEFRDYLIIDTEANSLLDRLEAAAAPPPHLFSNRTLRKGLI